MFIITGLFYSEDPVKLNLNGLKVIAEKEITNRINLLTSINKLLDEALKIDFVNSKGKIIYSSNSKLNSIAQQIKKQTAYLRESSRKVLFYGRLIELFESEYKAGPIKKFFADKVVFLAREGLTGLIDKPDSDENSIFFMNLSIALKSIDISDSEVWFLIKDFTDYVSIGKPKSLSSYFTLRESRYKTRAFKKSSNKIPPGLPIPVSAKK